MGEQYSQVFNPNPKLIQYYHDFREMEHICSLNIVWAGEKKVKIAAAMWIIA